jgi:hypothetical protein
MTEFLCLALIESLYPPGRTNIRLQLALDGVSTKIDRAVEPSRFKQAFRILQPLNRRLAKNRRPDDLRPDSSTHASLQTNLWSGGPDLNRQPSPWKSETLPLSYPRPVCSIKLPAGSK